MWLVDGNNYICQAQVKHKYFKRIILHEVGQRGNFLRKTGGWGGQIIVCLENPQRCCTEKSTESIGLCVWETQSTFLNSHQLWCSRLVDFLACLKDQALVGFMEAYFLLALVSHKSLLICCSGFIGEALRRHWSKWIQTTNTKKE